MLASSSVPARSASLSDLLPEAPSSPSPSRICRTYIWLGCCRLYPSVELFLRDLARKTHRKHLRRKAQADQTEQGQCHSTRFWHSRKCDPHIVRSRRTLSTVQCLCAKLRGSGSPAASRGLSTPRSASVCTPPHMRSSRSCWPCYSASHGCSTAASRADSLGLAEDACHRLANLRRRLHHVNARLRHRLHLALGGAFAAGDDRTGVSHAASWRRCLAGNKAHHRLLHIRLDELRSLLFVGSADLADHDDRFGSRIIIQQLQRIDVRRADDRIAADANRSRLPNPARRELIDGLVRQRARARDDADA